MIRTKDLAPDDLQLNRNNREVIAIINTAAIDRDNEIVLPSGLVTTGINYAGRSVMVAHDLKKLPVGAILWLKVSNNRVVCKFRISEKTEAAKDAYDLIGDDCLNFVSVGFLVNEESPPTPQEVKDNPTWAGALNVVRSWELIELSLAPVPANPEAVIVGKAVVDCWDYEAKTIDVKPTPIPKPKYCRKIDIDKTIKRAIARHDANEIIARIKGLA